MRLFNGTFHNGAIVLGEDSPFAEGEELTVCVLGKQVKRQRPEEITYEELDALFGNVTVDTRGWKFSREEANAR